MSPNAAARIERTLVDRILRGDYAPTSHLPPVRDLAREFDVTPATLQRALARLERSGLVVARRGSGVTVLDPRDASDLSLLPAWLRVLEDRPEAAASLLGDFLEIRRLMAVRLLVRHRARLLGHADALAVAASALSAAPRHDLTALAAADLGFARALIRATGNLAALAVLNTVGRVLDELPDVAAAMYADLDSNLASMAAVLGALGEEPGVLGAAVDEALSRVDGATVARYLQRLRDRA
jgi:GntR family transcriptional repressor for pyruvate dehydrogenase complex